MNTITIELPMVMREDADHRTTVNVSATTVTEALCRLTSEYPALNRRVYAAPNTLHPFVKVFVNDRDVSKGSLDERTLQQGDIVHLFSAVAGG